jgi:hypothetical protein
MLIVTDGRMAVKERNRRGYNGRWIDLAENQIEGIATKEDTSKAR